MRLNFLFGFLGSGKTTLARRLIKEGAGDKKMAVIVNEFGDVGIDGQILEGQDLDMIELTSGCLCCTLKGSLINAVEELNAKESIDVIVVEATGVAEPEEMIETFADETVRGQYEIGPMVTVIDIPKFTRLKEMLGPFYEAQVQNADVLVLNKVDLATADDLETARKAVIALNEKAELLFTEQCELNVHDIISGSTSRKVACHESVSHHAHDHDHDHDHDHQHAPAQSFVLDASGSTERRAIEGFFLDLPENVWRVKGYTRIGDQPVLIQFTMGQLEITSAEVREHYHMVFIGPHMDRDHIEAEFSNLLDNVRSE
tara:strand:- start:65 stop:1009 length:945 start_codon:yes stop_codon:yes gene_type:complete